MSETKQFTTAIIAAMPAEGDPIHDVVDANPHVTLHFLGEAAELDEDTVEQIKADLALVASQLHPFDAQLSGTAELGPDKAKVVLVQSEPLTKLRELLGTTAAVSTATSAVEQYPNWIPHLTLSYDEAAPDSEGYESFKVGALGLWLAGEQVNFPLGKAAPVITDEDDTDLTASAITAAVGKYDFDSSLHPRGADGRFIEKFGIIKFLTGKGWAYGKVDGIGKDDTGTVQITVTPSNLAGEPSGAPAQQLTPNKIYRAPKAKAHLTTSAQGTQKIGGQGGSNPGGLYSIPKFGMLVHGADNTQIFDKYYVKTPKSKSHGQNEALANLLYEEAGVAVPEVDLHPDGQLYSKIIDGQQDMADKLKDPAWAEQVQRNFAVDAWLGNRDVFGMTYDNVLTDENGTPFRIDNGGALLYRAMGAKKDDFGSKVTELDAFRQGKKSAIYGSTMSKASEIDGAERVLAISPDRIEEAVADAGLPKSLADTLKARRLYIASYYGLALPETKNAPGAQENSSAPLVDAHDLAVNKGKARNWTKMPLNQALLTLETGDTIELPDGSLDKYGLNGMGDPFSMVGTAAQVLGWQNEHGATAEVMVRKRALGSPLPRPEEGTVFAAADLPAQTWERGDTITAADGKPYKVLGVNRTTGAVLVVHGDEPARLLDTFGEDSAGTWTAHRWDPPKAAEPELFAEPVVIKKIPETLEELLADPEVDALLSEPADEELTSYQATPDGYEPVEGPETPADTAADQTTTKTGQAAEAEAEIKADLDTPLPTGAGAPAPAKTTAPGGAKAMLIGDGTEAATGAKLLSNKDGKSYVFVKPKGQYAVVTDPNGEDPSKQLLKLASTMTQPGATPTVDTSLIEKPKTATGEIPALGMMAQAKDGWAGEITLISPDGKFVFITDANGKRKRKSTGTVSVTAGAQPVEATPVPAPSSPETDAQAPAAPSATGGGAPQLKPYGAEQPPVKEPFYDSGPSGYFAPEDLNAGQMVHVAYGDGTSGIEPWSGQPLAAVRTNATGKVAVYEELNFYQGVINADALVTGVAATNGAGRLRRVLWNGILFQTNGTTGPNGGLVLWDIDLPGGYALELPPGTGHAVTILDITSVGGSSLPPFDQVASPEVLDADYTPPLPVLWGEEAKQLGAWLDSGQVHVGTELSLDGANYVTVQSLAGPGGGVTVADINNATFYLGKYSGETFVLKAPSIADGDAVVTPTPVAEEKLDGAPTVSGKDLIVNQAYLNQGGDVVVVDEVTSYGGNAVEVSWLNGTGTKTWVHEDETFTLLGDAVNGYVPMPQNQAYAQAYPGMKFKIEADSDLTMVVASYPVPNGDDGYKVVAFMEGNPDSLIMVGSQTKKNPLVVQFGPSVSSSALGVDPAKIIALFGDSITAPASKDEHWEMAEAGLPYGELHHEVLVKDGNFYKAMGPGGKPQVWDVESSSWKPVTALPSGTTVAWAGGGGPNTIGDIPGSSALNLLDNPDTNFVLSPGAAVTVLTLTTGKQVLALHPDGDVTKPGYAVINPTQMSNSPYSDSTWSGFDKAIFYDPYGSAEGPVEPGAATKVDVLHQQGPTPPAAIAEKVNAYAAAGDLKPNTKITYWVNPEMEGVTQTIVEEDGKSFKLFDAGNIGKINWSEENLGQAGYVKQFDWTYVPEGESGPTPLTGLPEDYAPFVPNGTQSVLKASMPNGKVAIYLQNQPGGGWYLMEPDGTVSEDSGAVKSNHAVQQKLANPGLGSVKYALLWPEQDTPTAETTADIPEFKGYTPSPGEEVWLDTDGDAWLKKDGQVAFLMPGAQLSAWADEANWKYGNGATKAWPVDTEVADEPIPSFNGYTPKPGQIVLQSKSKVTTWVKNDDQWQSLYKGELDDSTVLPDADIQELLDSGDLIQAWPAPGAAVPAAKPDPSLGGIYNGVQTKPTDSVISFTTFSGGVVTLVKPAELSTWVEILPNGQLNDPGTEWTQDSVDWAKGKSEYNLTVLQGNADGAPVDVSAAVSPGGVPTSTVLSANSATTTDGYALTEKHKAKLDGLTLLPGEKLIAVSGVHSDPAKDGVLYKVSSTGEVYAVFGSGDISAYATATSEQELLADLASLSGAVAHTVTQGAPTAPPAPTGVPFTGQMNGWAAAGSPDPTTFQQVSDIAGASFAAGTWLFLTNGPNKNGGTLVKLGEQYNPGDAAIKAESYQSVTDLGTVGETKYTSTLASSPFILIPTSAMPTTDVYATGTNLANLAPAAPAQAPSAPQAAPAAMPDYPGATKPSAEDVASWGGSLTKDGHIPSPGMFVTGKGPMAGKIIGVSKDKTKATVLTADGKKSVRLIEALKTDVSANYMAYAAPVSAKDIPGGMPLAVDTPAEALAKTVKDGKFRAILSGHPGVSQGQMVVTKATGPSGKAYNRVHLTLTPEQRTLLLAQLSGTGEKGDWATKSKMSDQVAIGDQLPMRKSSTDNPDGTPRWKVDPETKPPTHTVTAVSDDPSGSGLKIVTMTNNVTGETITSRFHPGKNLAVYSWDPNKPKVAPAGSFSLSPQATAMGWALVKDGGISASSNGDASNAQLYQEPGKAVSNSALGALSSNWQTLRHVSGDGVVVETVDPKGSSGASSTGVTVISIPEGLDETALGGALSALGIDYSPMTQDGAKTALRGLLRTYLSLDTKDVDTTKGWSDEKLFSTAGETMGISDLGWQDVSVAVDETTGKLSFFWSDRARTALASKAKFNLVYRSASNGSASQIVSTIKYGTANAILKKTTGMVDGTDSSKPGNGASASSDNANHAGHGGYLAASKMGSLPTGNAGYKGSAGMMAYYRPESILGRIGDYRLAGSDAFGMGQGQGANHMKAATTMASVTDFFVGGGLASEALGFLAVASASERTKAIAQLKADGFNTISGRPIEDIIVLISDVSSMSPMGLPPVALPTNIRPILDLPTSYDAAPTAEVAAA